MRRLIQGASVFACGLLAAAVLFTFSGCGKSSDRSRAGDGASGQPVEVTLVPVRIGALQKTVEVTGTLYGDESATIRAKVPGQIVAVSADVGDRIAPMHELARIDPTDYQLAVNEKQASLEAALAELGLKKLPGENFDVASVATVQRAQAEAENARAKFQRAQQLYDRKPPLLSEQDYQDIRTASEVAAGGLEVAKLNAAAQLAAAKTRYSELQTATQQLNDTVVGAPNEATDAQTSRFAVVQRMVSVGDYAKQGDPLFELVADDPIKYRASVPERLLGQVKVGQRVTLKVEALSEAFTGKVTRITPVVDTATRTFMVEVEFSNAEHQLKPGSFGRGVIDIGQQPNVTQVPRDAIVSFAGVDKIYTVSDGKAVEHRVTKVEQNGEWVAIQQKFDAGMKVVLQGVNDIADGSAIRIIEPK